MKKIISALVFSAVCASFALGQVAKDPFFPLNEYYSYNSTFGIITGFAGGVGNSTSAAIHVSGRKYVNGALEPKPGSYTFVEWASGCAEYVQGTGITGSGTDNGSSYWTTPSNAFGKATASDTAAVVVLGDGGSITLTFDNAITNGSGYDFAVFENALNNTFLEFAFVEVSSDGVNFLRFPNFYLGSEPVGSDSSEGGGVNDPTYAYNLGSKYKVGNGNGYDLQELIEAYNYVVNHYDFDNDTVTDSSIFTDDYAKSILDNFDKVDLNNIGYVKIVDIVGDGNTLDSSGTPIYDAYPTHGTPGFDLSGVGVFNQVPEPAETIAIIGAAAMLMALWRRRKAA